MDHRSREVAHRKEALEALEALDELGRSEALGIKVDRRNIVGESGDLDRHSLNSN